MPTPIEINANDPSHVAALKRAVNHAGGQKPLADKMRPYCTGDYNPTQSLVWHWLKRESRIPAEWVVPIEKATGGLVTRNELRPDISWQ